MVNCMTTTNGKVVKLSFENYLRLKHLKHKLELDSFDATFEKLFEQYAQRQEVQLR